MKVRHNIEDEYEKPTPNKNPEEHLTPALCCRHVVFHRNADERPRKADDTGEKAAAALHMQLRRAVAKQTIPP